MKTNITYKISFIFFSSIFFVACSPKNNNFDIDLSNLPKPKVKVEKNTNTEIQKSIKHLNKEYISNLKPLKDREQVLSKFKFGKRDPFSKSEIQFNKLSLNLKLTGFLNTEIEKYVFVNFLGKEGTITKNSIGGVNTNLLPEGAKVINIDTRKLELTINHENENYLLEL